MIEIEKPRIDTEVLSADGTYGKFVVEPLERGFGTTLGNSLRRVLLSSLPGVAVTSIKIDGVLHEFSTIPGVKEDVTEIVLNMKGLTAKLHCDGAKTVEISAEGPCEVTADSIKCDSEVEILNPEMHIATLDNKHKFALWLVGFIILHSLRKGGAENFFVYLCKLPAKRYSSVTEIFQHILQSIDELVGRFIENKSVRAVFHRGKMI